MATIHHSHHHVSNPRKASAMPSRHVKEPGEQPPPAPSKVEVELADGTTSFVELPSVDEEAFGGLGVPSPTSDYSASTKH
ncbi:hypothetical protein [Streptomyces sp. NBC_00140]|uniref:hypothetical protein n=1 Tax=Streptomyces sp. NBC_00140 TaxID=2975664 RepID=UPI00224FB760|nr:hypothetical protein [Streptomyces sp. NBC_00140]MCX5330004.1 hypothetical protein [Streptomyces sp. NBC_00140]